MNKRVIESLHRDLKSDDQSKRMNAIVILNSTYGISSVPPQTLNTMMSAAACNALNMIKRR